MHKNQELILRSRIFFLLAILISGVIVVRICYIQIIIGPNLKQKAHKLHFEERVLHTTRGNVLDRNGKILATTLPYYKLAIDPSIIVEDTVFKEKITSLSEDLKIFFEEKKNDEYIDLLFDIRSKKKKYVLLSKKNIDHKNLLQVKSWPIFNTKQFKEGGIIEKTNMRFKPYKNLCSRTIGYYNANDYGAGIEYSLNKYLKGKNGSAIYKKTASGVWQIINNKIIKRPKHGYDIKTTIDIDLQDSVNASLLAVLKSTQTNNACAIVMEVVSGEILAMVNLSATDQDPEYTEKYNYAIAGQGVREPGSIFKLVSFIALLEETNLGLNEIIDTGNGKMQFHDRVMKDLKYGGYGKITLQEIFEKSSNIGISYLITKYFGENPYVFMGYLKKLNLHKPSGIEIFGEGCPNIPNVKNKQWSKVSLPWISIGYEVEFSPLQMLMLYNAVANNGQMIKPMIVKGLYHKNKLIKNFLSITTIRKICSKKTLDKLKIMLEGVIERGSANKFNGSFYKIAGKSGTANILKDGVYSEDTHVSFVGYFPAENPKYSCIITMDKTHGQDWRYGSHLATIVQKIANKLASTDLNEPKCIINKKNKIKNSSIFPMYIEDYNSTLEVITQNPELQIFSNNSMAICKIINNKCQYSVINSSKNNVPNLLNMRLKDAVYLLDSLQIQYEITGDLHARIKKQSQKPNSPIIKNQILILEMC